MAQDAQGHSRKPDPLWTSAVKLAGACGLCRTARTLGLDYNALKRRVAYVAHYNTARLHSAIGYVAPVDKLEGRERAIFAGRDRKLHEAREARRARRQAVRQRRQTA